MQEMQENIFLHGLGQTPCSWDRTLSYLPAHIRTQPLDLTSLCKSKNKTYSNLYSTFKDYCSHISEPTNLCGVSLGAVLALNYAIEYPKKVKSLVLIAPQYKMPLLLLKFQGLIFNFMPEHAFKDMGFSKKDFSILTKSMLGLDFSNEVKNIECSSLIICGKKDSANMKAAKDLAIKIPSARLRLIENAGHEVNVDAPEELAAIIKSFLQFSNDIR